MKIPREQHRSFLYRLASEAMRERGFEPEFGAQLAYPTVGAVRAGLAGRESPFARQELELLARHCTEKESDAQRVERRLVKSAAALLLEDRWGEAFDGIVTGASPKGTWVRIFDPPVEGRVERGARGLDVGDKVRVKLIHTNPERGFIDFERVDHEPVGPRPGTRRERETQPGRRRPPA